MKIKVSYLNDDYTIEFDEEIKAGVFLAFFIRSTGIVVPIVNHYNHPIALQMWSTSYCLVLDQSMQIQAHAINFDFPINISQTGYIDADEFSLSINEYFKDIEKSNLSISKTPNKYSDFRTELQKGSAAYIQNIKSRHLTSFIHDSYTQNDFEQLRANFDNNGLFTRNILNSKYFLDDKSCDEDPLYALSDIAQFTFASDTYEFFITLIFDDSKTNNQKQFTMDKNGKTDFPQEHINELYTLYGAPNYHIKLVHQGIEVEGAIEFLRYSLPKRLALFNQLLHGLGRPDKWFILSNGSCVLTTDDLYQKLIESNLLPPDSNYFNPWEY